MRPEGNDQRVGLHFTQQQLDTTVVNVDEVFKDEHLVDDALGQLGIVFANVVEDGGFVGVADKVEDVGSIAHAAHGGFLAEDDPDMRLSAWLSSYRAIGCTPSRVAMREPARRCAGGR